MTDPIETAWRIHACLNDWTGKVDAKATFGLAIESGVFVAALGLTGGDHRLSHVSGADRVLIFAGFALLVAAIMTIGDAVRPRLRTRAVKAEADENLIFFGHLRFRDPADVEAALRDEPDLLAMLSRQLVAMARIAWRKHRELQPSLSLAAVGSGLLGLAAALA